MARKAHISGITTVYGEGDQALIDIIAIHGIAAKSIQTWTKKNSNDQYVNWLEDECMLPSRVPNARIMIYGYESNWHGENTIATTVRPIAVRFIDHIIIEREETNTPRDRPIIVLAHCFGGIVLVKALKEAKDDHPDLFQCFKGFIFLGTPFRGVAGSLGNGSVEGYWKNQGETVRGDILNVLRHDSGALKETMNFFKSSYRESHWQMVCFYEQKQSNVWALAGNKSLPKEFVVTQDSACLDMADDRALERDHFDMNKFEGPNDPDYKIVAIRVQKMVKNVIGTSHPPGLSASSKVSVTSSETPASETFSASDWIEGELAHFDTGHTCWSARLADPNTPHRLRRILRSKSQIACGVSADCYHVFTFHEDRLLVFPVPFSKPEGDLDPYSVLEPPHEREFRAVSMGSSIIAISTAEACYVRKLDEHHWHLVVERKERESWQYGCVAIHEKENYISVAVSMETASARPEAVVVVYEVGLRNWTSQKLCDPIQLRRGDWIDPARRLSFSPDSEGKLLICITSVFSQVFVWSVTVGLTGGKVQEICTTQRSSLPEHDSDGLTAAKCWLSDKGHPYMLVTTSPSSQHVNREDQWSFIAPISDPFPGIEDPAFHCLTGGQNRRYHHIISGAVSNAGNAVALLTEAGDIGIFPLQALHEGYLSSRSESSQGGSAPVAVSKKLNSGLRIFQADTKFDPDDSRLVAVDRHGKLVVANFKQKGPMAIRGPSTLTRSNTQQQSGGARSDADSGKYSMS